MSVSRLLKELAHTELSTYYFALNIHQTHPMTDERESVALIFLIPFPQIKSAVFDADWDDWRRAVPRLRAGNAVGLPLRRLRLHERQRPLQQRHPGSAPYRCVSDLTNYV